ncbi:MAG: FMN-binding protein [Pseudomonadota bacterium]
MRSLLILLLVLTAPALSLAATTEPVDAFVADAFEGRPHESRMLWLTPDIKARAARILGHDYAGLRVRYWRGGTRTVWVLDEIGKELPITIGVVVDRDRIVRTRVLAFREARGGEVRHGFFTRQFADAALVADDRLDRSIDGITGATLSVWAVTRVSRLALAFHQEALRNG